MFVCTSGVQAATLELQPVTGTANINDTISLNLVLNVGANENVWGYEAYISFPTDLLTYNSSGFVAGSVFADYGKTVQSLLSDKVAVGGSFDVPSKGTTTGGVVATLNFTAKAAGTATAAIICDQFTNVWSIAPSVNYFTTCATLAPKSIYTIAGAGVAATPTPTMAAGVTSTPTPTTSSSSSTATATPTPVGGITQLPATGSLQGEILLICGLIFVISGGFVALGFSRITSGYPRIRNRKK